MSYLLTGMTVSVFSYYSGQESECAYIPKCQTIPLTDVRCSSLYHTRDWRLNIQHSSFLAQDGGAFIDDAQGHSLLQPALLGEVSFKQVHPRPAFSIKHLLHGKPVGQGEGDRYRRRSGVTERTRRRWKWEGVESEMETEENQWWRKDIIWD